MARKKKDGEDDDCGCDSRAAAISDYKIAEFARLDLPGLMFPGPGGGAAPPLDWWIELMKGIHSYSDWVKEYDKIKAKIERAVKVVIPPAEEPGGVILPPQRLRPGQNKLRQVLEVLKAAKEAADNLEPESARDSLREAKGLMLDEDVRAEFRRITAGRVWYDILEEMQDAIDYLDRASAR